MWNNLRLFLWMTFLTGILYPLLITIVAQLAVKEKADGGLISLHGHIAGAQLIGQKFESARYFWGRPSAIDYKPLPSGATNFGPTSSALKKIVQERRQKLAKSHNVEEGKVPAELLFASGSGLDPHISLAAAYFQTGRIAAERGIDRQKVKELVDQLAIKRTWGFLGEPCVNVLLLNIFLEK
jgi:K+-transporting ATPase ATPase C chain